MAFRAGRRTGGPISRRALASWAIDVESFADRSSVVLTLLLTTVAFQLAVNDQLPKVPYSTVATHFMRAGTVFLTCLVVENALVTAMPLSEDVRRMADRWLYLVIGIVWLLGNVVPVLLIRRYLHRVDALLGQTLEAKFSASDNAADRYSYGNQRCIVAAQGLTLAPWERPQSVKAFRAKQRATASRDGSISSCRTVF